MNHRLRSAVVALPLLAAIACGRAPAASPAGGGIVVAQVPIAADRPTGPTLLDRRSPAGSRIVLAAPPFDPKAVQVLSTGLVAAGEPFVVPDGTRVLFSGKESASDPWQVWQAPLDGSAPPSRLTALEGGASSPTLLADGSIVVVSPVALPGDGWFPKRPTAIYAIAPDGGEPKRLTFGTASVADPTVLADGRILFVSALPPASSPRLSLFTVYNDGTGILPYAAQHDGASSISRPRELAGGRVAFLSGDDPATTGGLAESVLSARPWRSRAPLFAAPSIRILSVESDGDGALVALASAPAGASSGAIHPLPPGATGPGSALFDDPAWHDVEAVRAEPRRRPAGRISTLNPTKTTGTIFCIDAQHTTDPSPSPATRVRLLADGPDGPRSLGDLPLQPDGSFLAEVPADLPVGFEALDADGNVLRRIAPFVWVRPGENRGCIGCHEPHGLAPRNRRPLAVKLPAVALEEYSAAGKGTP